MRVSLPTIRAQIEIDRGNPAKAIELLRPTVPYEFGWDRAGAAELHSRPGVPEGAPGFGSGGGVSENSGPSRDLPRRRRCARCPTSGLGRARALTGDNAGARTAYQDFFALWKDADPDVPILKEAKAEYAKLPQ